MNESGEKIVFTEEEKKLLKKYIDEYNDIYEKIFHFTQNEFMSNLKERVEISLKEKINFFPLFSLNKIEKYFIQKYYIPDLKLSLIAKRHILNQNLTEKEHIYFEGNIIPHCDKDKDNNYYIHSCGQKFNYFKYKISAKNIENENIIKNNNLFLPKTYDYILYCEKCDNIYKSSMIKIKCFYSGIIYYSKIINKNDYYKEPCYATWKKYHCNAIINDTIKCQICKNSFIYNEDKNILICLKCHKELNPLEIKFTCFLCKKEFISEIKIYNPLEYKMLKISIKDALIKKENAFPKYMGCKCNLDINNTHFFHKVECDGDLYFGEINKKKIVVCSKCDSIGNYDEFIWTCPKCFKRFKIKKNNNNGNEYNENVNKNFYENKKSNTEPLNIEKKPDNLKKDKLKYLKIKKNKDDFVSLEINRSNSLRSENVLKSINTNLEQKILSDSQEILNEKENALSSRIKVKKRIFNDNGNKYERSQEKNNTINGSSKATREKIFKKKFKIFLQNPQTSLLKDNNISILKQKKKFIFRRSTNFLSHFNSRDNSVKNYLKTSREKENILTTDHFDISRSLIYKKDINKMLNNSKGINKNKDISKGIITSENSNKMNSLNVSFEKNHSENKYIKIKKYIKRQSINNIKGNKEKENHFKKLEKNEYISNKNKYKSTNNIKFKGENTKNITNLKNKTNNGIISPREYTKINLFDNNRNQLKKGNFKTNDNIDNRNELINKNNIEEKNQKNKLNQEKNLVNKCSISTSYESDQNSKFNSLKLGQLYYNNNINNNEYNNISEYKIIKQIGRGTFGQIFMVENEKKEFFALKKIIACSMKEIQILEHEYKILFNINISDENIDLVKIYKIETKQLDPTTFVMYVLMELSNTDWEKEILKRRKDLNYYTENQLISIMSSLIKTFSLLQKKNISHRDIKPQNVLVFNDNKYKLADFGEAKELLDDTKVTEKRTLRGTELYMSPILFFALKSRKPIKYVKHNIYKSDVFSFGLCLLFAASLTFESIYDVRELTNNEEVNKVVEKYLGERYSKKLVNFIKKMIDLNEDTRSDFIELEQEFNYIKNHI